MAKVLSTALILTLFESVFALRCYNCACKIDGPQRHIYGSIDTSPQQCERLEFCQGQWCTQQLKGDRATFGCSEYALTPIAIQNESFWRKKHALSKDHEQKKNKTVMDNQSEDTKIRVQCNAYYDIDYGTSHAVCYCRNADLCNRANGLRMSLAHSVFLFINLMVLAVIFLQAINL